MQKETVFEFIENHKLLPKSITVERTQVSKYLFLALAREYRRKLRTKQIFFTYSKAELNAVKSTIEEHSFLNLSGSIYVMEGFSLSFIETLNIPEGSYCVAETDNGELSAPSYNFRMKRDILRLLSVQLELRLNLRSLMSIDWSSCRDYADYEAILRKVKLMRWSEAQIGQHLKNSTSGHVLANVKRGQFKESFDMMKKYQPMWLQNHLIELITELCQYRILKEMGREDEKIAKDMDLSWTKKKELEETAAMLDQSDLNQMAERMVKLDQLMTRNKELGLSLYLLNAPIRIST